MITLNCIVNHTMQLIFILIFAPLTVVAGLEVIMNNNSISLTFISQEDLIQSGAFDIKMAIRALCNALIDYKNGNILFPEKVVQIFNQETQERINCLPATLLKEKICGMKWVSVFPNNPRRFGTQNLSAVIILSEIEKGYPITIMDGTLCSNLRVAAMGAVAAKYCSREEASVIGFIGAGEQAKMHLLAMYSVRPGLKKCKVASRTLEKEQEFIKSLQKLLPDIEFISCNTNLESAIRGSDIIVTATSAQAPLLKMEWIGEGTFYSHIGGWEDEYSVVQKADKLICDDWEAVKHRTQTISRCYHEGIINDGDIYANIADLVDGTKKGRENDKEFIYFNAVGLAYIDIAIAYAMYIHAVSKGFGQEIWLQKNMIFENDLSGKVIF